MRVLQIVHGYPPRETAGTEIYAGRVAAGLAARGHAVHTLAIGPAVGRRPYERTEEPGLTRVAQNAPWSALWNGASDRTIDRIVESIADDCGPDVVHVQHLAFASTTWRAAVPVVWTLHDAWAWCAADGRLLRNGAPCTGPSSACGACAAQGARDGPGLARALDVAGQLGRWIPAHRLQDAWRRLPAGVQAGVLRTRAGAPPDIGRRNTAFRAFAERCDQIVSPSHWLAEAARAEGIRVDAVLPHGVDPAAGPAGPAVFLFLGTLARHKGPDLVREAWRRSGTSIPLHIHGPPGPDPSFAVPNRGPLAPAAVPRALRGATALVLGSVWPENAPLVVLEARAAGCPVIAPRIGGIPEIVTDGVDGWLYPPGDIESLASCLRLAAGNRLTPTPAPTFTTHLDALLALYEAARRVHNVRARQ